MKKILLTFGLAGAVVFTSCQNENSANPQPTLGTATITGKLYADTNLKNAGDEAPPAGTKVIAIIDAKDLAITVDNSRTYAKKYYEGSTDASGKFSITVEVGADPIAVQVVTADFMVNVVNADNTVNPDVIFKGSTTPVNVYKNGVFLVNITY